MLIDEFKMDSISFREAIYRKGVIVAETRFKGQMITLAERGKMSDEGLKEKMRIKIKNFIDANTSQ